MTLAIGLFGAGLGPAYAENTAAPPAPACAAPLLAEAVPAAEALEHLTSREERAAAALNETSVAELAEHARADDALWLDECGRTLFVDEAHPAAIESGTQAGTQAGPQTQAATTAPLVPLEETFTLASRPGSKRTVYLDFTGHTVTGTAWNSAVGQGSFTVPPYTMDTSAGFSATELTQIQRAWAIVAEDYAPFDVNVTTADPGTAAIDRSSAADDTYGGRVVITAGGPVWEANGRPGGISYTGILDYYSTWGRPGHGYYQPSWAFTNGTGTDGKGVGEAVAHELGHAFGLSHDGLGDNPYYRGNGTWAPIMGAGYYAPVTQWSAGEYAGATNTEDDLAVIAAVAAYVGDDHANTASGATSLDADGASGLISRRGDRDTFVFAAAGSTEVAVTPTALQPDLDVSLTVRDSAGRILASADPAVGRRTSSTASGLDAAVSFEAPADGAWFTAVVDGAGYGDPATAGQYSDYASLGAYRITVGAPGTGTIDPDQVPAQYRGPLATTAAPTGPMTGPLTFRRARLAAARVGRRYRGVVTIAGAAEQVRWTRRGRLPAGIRVRVLERGTKIALRGKPRQPGRYTFVLRGADDSGRTVARTFRLVVRR